MSVKSRNTRSPRNSAPTRSALPEHVVRAVLEHQDARVVIDRNGRIVLVNSAAERQLRRVMSELVGKSAASFKPLAGAETVGTSGRLKIVAPR